MSVEMEQLALTWLIMLETLQEVQMTSLLQSC